ncbi:MULTISPECIES: M3 family metallopeptidase [Parabacteroides]|jgi:peptidyl-dipeptidase Dcp|nr:MULTISPECIES: M3 family metallopeptidase [Parabacteroides]MBF0767613.1 M3 family metallopeptidase [Parabacteroides goldsteinii]MBS6577501.1 M3 family metallopeptidase [Parabacteroides goldsteinii]MDZ3930014.1 M3 family metallopeptidase [Parabacteroides goldsteinii]NBI97797.1 M3 family peptidase [Parabacteroides goldsteinii]NDO65526.1 M3 family metallopeptidase [Parabacteroides goldsteinii]
MNKALMAAGLAVVLGACNSSKKSDVADAAPNPFFTEYTTPFGVPPFDKIEVAHYKPAFEKGMEEQKKEIDAIVNNPEEPTFENTIVALDRSGELLTKVMYAFSGQSSVNTTDEIQALEQELYPVLSAHSDDISLNPALFTRVKVVYDKQASMNLNKEQKKLLEETYKGFVRGGANLDADKQARLRELNEKISVLELTFGQNVLKETNAFKLVVDNKEDLAGLPESLIAAAAETAAADSMEGKWIFTLHNPSVMPFLQYADNRALREKIFKAYINRGNNGNGNDNKNVVKELVAARLDKAKLLGYEDFAAFVLDENMAKNEKNVYNLLDQIWTPALKKAKEELADINAEIKKEGGDFEAEGWDWRYYADKARQAKFNMDENEVRPYLELNHVREGAFYVANKLYGITFTEIKDIPKPDPDAFAFECKDKDGSSLGVLYMDFYTRPGKGGGAWCGGYRDQSYKDGKKVLPVVTTVFNFSKPAAGQPALLSADEAETVFHEFGHALHGLFADVHYTGVAGVPRDFVELPSQVMEHWVFEPEVLKVYAKHYQTGEVIPQELVDKIVKSSKYGQGFATVEYLAASLLDMDYHTLKEQLPGMDIEAFEAEAMNKRGLIRQIPPRYRTTYFGHTMEGGYTAGYYSYIWAEVLDADAFEAYKETGDIFNPEVASKFRKYVLTPGGIDDAMDMYKNFRGKEPGIEPLLKNRGLK